MIDKTTIFCRSFFSSNTNMINTNNNAEYIKNEKEPSTLKNRNNIGNNNKAPQTPKKQPSIHKKIANLALPSRNNLCVGKIDKIF